MIKANELRIGNLVEYKITDEFDERKEWWEVSEIDADDIHWLSKVDTNDDDFRAIPLTEEILLKCGFEFVRNNDEPFYQLIKNGIVFNSDYLSEDDSINCVISTINSLVKFKYLHQLQNIFFALTNEELSTNLLTKNK